MGHVQRLARPPRALSAATSLSLSALFVAVYGATGWLASLRPNVATWAFEWERNLPLVRWLIVPYMSLDLFFAAAPFLCADREELRTLWRRMTSAILIAGAVFTVMPLGYAFAVPEPAGWTAPIFRALHAFDRPYNLFPSLHIAILLILAGTYDRHSHGLPRWFIRAWFALIAASTVLTRQHHVIDLAGGFALALCCCYAIHELRTREPVTTNVRVGGYYAGGAVVLTGLAAWLRPWGLLLLWPAASMVIVAGAYVGLYAAIARKQQGRLSVAARAVLAPWLLGQQLSLVYYRRHAAPWNEVAPGVWIGRQLNQREAVLARKCGAVAVIDLTGEFSESGSLLSLAYLNLQVLDLTTPTADQIRAALDFINAHRTCGAVLVHCKIGYSRSATVVACWLLDAGLSETAELAVARIRAVRPTLVLRPEGWATLRRFAACGGSAHRFTTPRLMEVRT